jgi:hypothetical protein
MTISQTLLDSTLWDGQTGANLNAHLKWGHKNLKYINIHHLVTLKTLNIHHSRA